MRYINRPREERKAGIRRRGWKKEEGWFAWKGSDRRKREEIDRGRKERTMSGGKSSVEATWSIIDSLIGGGIVRGRSYHPSHGWWA